MQLQSLIETQEGREAFGAFVAWAFKTTEPKRVTLDLSHHVRFFEQLSTLPRDSWTGSGLLDHFGTAQLRSFELAVRWMTQQKGVELSGEQKLLASEQARIQQLLDTPPVRSPARLVLSEFAKQLVGRLSAGEISARTVRFSLRPAVDLLERCGWGPVPQQVHLNDYLRLRPGQRAATFAFVTFLKREHHLELQMPAKRSAGVAAAAARKRQERRINALLDEAPRSGDFEKRWLQEALVYFHRLSARDARRLLSEGAVDRDEDGYGITVGEQRFWVPHPDSAASAGVVRHVA